MAPFEHSGPTALTPAARRLCHHRRMMRYRFLDAMGDVVDEAEFPDHESAIAWATDGDADHEDDIQRVEFLGPEGDWRWAGALSS